MGLCALTFKGQVCKLFFSPVSQSPKIAICMNKPCICCASMFFSSMSAQVRGESLQGVCITSVTHFSQSSTDFCGIKKIKIKNCLNCIRIFLFPLFFVGWTLDFCLSPYSCPHVASLTLSNLNLTFPCKNNDGG